MPILILALVFFLALAFGGLVLLSLALRYRAGTARRQSRRWAAALNVWMTSFSALLFLFLSFVMSYWLGPSLRNALFGMFIGIVLGLLGLVLTRWESKAEGLFYTPSRWLALLITLAVTARFAYGWWHATHPRTSGEEHWFLSTSGTQLSLAVAAGLIGYYLSYAIGVFFRLRRHERNRRT